VKNYVYFIRAKGGGGPVKIGYSYKPTARMAILAAWSPHPLEIVATIEGAVRIECRFHAMFAHLHSHHEWFLPSPELDAVIASINAGSFDLSSLPAGKRLPIKGPPDWARAA